jgi:hypothetical protein
MVVGATACVEREQVPPQRAAATADPALQKAERLPFSPRGEHTGLPLARSILLAVVPNTDVSWISWSLGLCPLHAAPRIVVWEC